MYLFGSAVYSRLAISVTRNVDRLSATRRCVAVASSSMVSDEKRVDRKPVIFDQGEDPWLVVFGDENRTYITFIECPGQSEATNDMSHPEVVSSVDSERYRLHRRLRL